MTTLNFARCGAGEPLVLIHGTGSRLEVWDSIMPTLAQHFDVVAIDLPGCGKSVPATPPTIRSMNDSVAAFIEELGLDRPHLVGNSIGGTIALELAARGLARSVTVFSPAGFWSSPGDLWFQTAMRAIHAIGSLLRPQLPALLRARPTRALLFGLVVGRPGQLDPGVALGDALGVLDTDGFSSLMGSLRRHRNRPSTVADEIPVTVAWGTRDRLLTYRTQSRRARRSLPHARHLVLDRCGHIPFYDDPIRCTATILDQFVLRTTATDSD